MSTIRKISHKTVKIEIELAEENLELCWIILRDIKTANVKSMDFGERFIKFQDRLASSIFRLRSVRSSIILQEKKYIANKIYYNYFWFAGRMALLARFKQAIESVIHIAKSLGDAYAYFFYQFDRELLTRHLNHERVVNHNAGIGERGELEFIKKVKHIEGHFTLFHDITNILRFGDFSFIDLRSMKVLKIGELKTKKIDPKTLNLELSLFKRNHYEAKKEPISKPYMQSSRKDRQTMGIINFLIPDSNTNVLNKNIIRETYAKEINSLVDNTKNGKITLKQVSSGLIFSCYKMRKVSLYNKLLGKKVSNEIIQDLVSKELVNSVKRILKKESQNNSIIIGQLLYNPKLIDISIPGTIPLFWHPIDIEIAKKLYFTDIGIFSLFNPAHLIDSLEELGYSVESKFTVSPKEDSKTRKGVERFDLFISYITNYLMTEEFVLDIFKLMDKTLPKDKNAKILIKPRQVFDIIHPTSAVKKS